MHLEDANLVGRAEAVLMATQYAIRKVVVALELKHYIDDMLQNLRARNRAILGYMSDDEDGYAELLGYTQELCRAATYLRKATW